MSKNMQKNKIFIYKVYVKHLKKQSCNYLNITKRIKKQSWIALIILKIKEEGKDDFLQKILLHIIIW